MLVKFPCRVKLKIMLKDRARNNHKFINDFLNIIDSKHIFKLSEFNILEVTDIISGSELSRLILLLKRTSDFIYSITGDIALDVNEFNIPEYKFNNITELEYYHRLLSHTELYSVLGDKEYLVDRVNNGKYVLGDGDVNHYIYDYEYHTDSQHFYFVNGIPYRLNTKLKPIGKTNTLIEYSNRVNKHICEDELLGKGFIKAIYTIEDDKLMYFFPYDIDYPLYIYRLLDKLLDVDSINYLEIYSTHFDYFDKDVTVFKFSTDDKLFTLIFPASFVKYESYIKNKLTLKNSGNILIKK